MKIKTKLINPYIEITSKCNRNCPYCYNDSNSKGIYLQKKLIFNLFDTCHKKNINQVTISGGEPFLHPNFNELVNYANKNNIYCRIVTNLSVCSYEQLLGLIKNGNFIQITLDSVFANKHDNIRGCNSFNKTIKILKGLLNEGLQNKVVLRFNVSKDNRTEIHDFIILAKKFKITQAVIVFLTKTGRANNYKYVYEINKNLDEINKIINEIKFYKKKYEDDIDITFSDLEEQRGCAIFNSQCVEIAPRIDPEGNVYFCSYFSGEENILGNINNLSLDVIVTSAITKNFIKKVRNRKSNINCKNCALSEICVCGCPAISFMNTGSIANIADQCYMIKYFVKNKLVESLRSDSDDRV